MNVTINIDCTPEEARILMGLPDVQTLQKRALAAMEQRLITELDRFSPESLLQSWFSSTPQAGNMLRDAFAGFLGGTSTKDVEK